MSYFISRTYGVKISKEPMECNTCHRKRKHCLRWDNEDNWYCPECFRKDERAELIAEGSI